MHNTEMLVIAAVLVHLVTYVIGNVCSVPPGFEQLGDGSPDYYKVDNVTSKFWTSASNCASVGGRLVGPEPKAKWDVIYSFFMDVITLAKKTSAQNSFWMDLHKNSSLTHTNCNHAACNTLPPRLLTYSDNATFVWESTHYGLFIDSDVANCFRGMMGSFHDAKCYLQGAGVCKIPGCISQTPNEACDSVAPGFLQLGDGSTDYYKVDDIMMDFHTSSANCANLGGTLVGPVGKAKWTALFNFFIAHRPATNVAQTLWVNLHKDHGYPHSNCIDAACNTIPPRLMTHSNNESFVWDTNFFNIYVDNGPAHCFRGYSNSYHDEECTTTDMTGLCKISCPTKTCSIPADYEEWVATSGRYYKFYDLVKSRDDASGICSADNTTLVSIESISHWAQIWSHIDSFYTGSLWGFWLPVKKGPGPHLHCTNTNCNSINYNLLLDDGGTLDWNTTWPMNLTTNGVTEDCFFGIRTEIKDISCGARSDVKILCEFSCKQDCSAAPALQNANISETSRGNFR